MSLIKICGLRSMDDVSAVNEGMPDFTGFVFARSRRQVTLDQAEQMREGLSAGIKAVGVFVNEAPERIKDICSRGIIDIVQLHGDENNSYIDKIRKSTGHKIIKAVRIRDRGDIERAVNFDSDYLLLDAWHEEMYGGSGRKFDWSMIDKLDRPFFLAGGLNKSNLALAAETVKPYCLDLSSGVETDGSKDRGKIIQAINIVRSVI